MISHRIKSYSSSQLIPPTLRTTTTESATMSSRIEHSRVVSLNPVHQNQLEVQFYPLRVRETAIDTKANMTENM